MGETQDALSANLQGRYIRDLSWKYNTLPTVTTTIGNTYTPKYLIEMYPENVTNEMFDVYGHLLPQYIQTQAYAVNANNALVPITIKNNSSFLTDLQKAIPISNIKQQEQRKTNSFILSSKNIDGQNYDVLVDKNNLKVFRNENNIIRIAVTNNGQWR